MAESKLYFGTDKLEEIGVVQSITDNESVEVAEARDEDGKVMERRAFSLTNEVSIEALVKKDKPVPKAGQTVTVEGKPYLITAVNKIKNNMDYRKVSYTASRKDNEEIVTYVEPATGG